MNTCCIISKVHPVSVRKGLFAGLVKEHQHHVSTINFKTVWPSQCVRNSGLLVHQGAFCMHLHYINIEHMLYCFQSPSCITKGRFICRSDEWRSAFFTVWQLQALQQFLPTGSSWDIFPMYTLNKCWLFPKSILYSQERFVGAMSEHQVLLV